ncbi:hypothetical protein WMY93_010414 [Mugilogobius chulae]|uniref:Uncharacterized protein n=1 Tax=Mugilogobius chulae TaxID=88201 RepID=A0AAW0P7P4_9GOBI
MDHLLVWLRVPASPEPPCDRLKRSVGGYTHTHTVGQLEPGAEEGKHNTHSLLLVVVVPVISLITRICANVPPSATIITRPGETKEDVGLAVPTSLEKSAELWMTAPPGPGAAAAACDGGEESMRGAGET